jgi:hypothetical protein
MVGLFQLPEEQRCSGPKDVHRTSTVVVIPQLIHVTSRTLLQGFLSVVFFVLLCTGWAKHHQAGL